MRWTTPAYRVAAQVRRLYWFTFRPNTRGVKCVLVHDGRWLMIRNTYGSGHWTFPGGGIHRSETPEAAAIREVAEEVGVRLDAVEAIGVYTNRREYKRDTVWCFRASVSSSTFEIDGKEIAEAAWYQPSAIPSFHGPSVDEIVRMFEPTHRP